METGEKPDPDRIDGNDQPELSPDERLIAERLFSQARAANIELEFVDEELFGNDRKEWSFQVVGLVERVRKTLKEDLERETSLDDEEKTLATRFFQKAKGAGIPLTTLFVTLFEGDDPIMRIKRRNFIRGIFGFLEAQERSVSDPKRYRDIKLSWERIVGFEREYPFVHIKKFDDSQQQGNILLLKDGNIVCVYVDQDKEEVTFYR